MTFFKCRWFPKAQRVILEQRFLRKRIAPWPQRTGISTLMMSLITFMTEQNLALDLDNTANMSMHVKYPTHLCLSVKRTSSKPRSNKREAQLSKHESLLLLP